MGTGSCNAWGIRRATHAERVAQLAGKCRLCVSCTHARRILHVVRAVTYYDFLESTSKRTRAFHHVDDRRLDPRVRVSPMRSDDH